MKTAHTFVSGSICPSAMPQAISSGRHLEPRKVVVNFSRASNVMLDSPSSDMYTFKSAGISERSSGVK